MGTKTFNNYEDLLTFTRASNGHALRPVSYGTELVTNGDGSTTTGWDLAYPSNTTLSASSGSLRATANASGAYGFSQDLSLSVGKLYRVVATIDTDNASGGTANLRISDQANLGGTQTTIATTTGTYYFNFIATDSTTYIGIVDTASTAGEYVEFDSISVKEVTFDESDGTLTLFEHPDNIPRVEWDADRNRLGLLVEEARTNLNPRSRPDSNWIASNVTLAENDSTAPDGTESATKITETTATSSHYTYAPAASFTSGTTYTISCFVKAGTKSLIQLTGSSGPFGGGLYANFDIANGTVGSTGSGTTATIQAIGNGWYRCVITGDATATAGASTAGVLYMIESLTAGRGPSFTGSTSNYLYAYGLQLEEASFPTSYIKTTGNTATRSADVASIPVADFGYNQSEGTVVATFEAQDTTSQQQFILGTDSGSARWLYSNSGGSDIFNFDGATTSSATGWVAGSISKAATSTDQSGKSLVVNGGSVATSTTNGNIASLPDTLFFGSWAGTSAILNGHIKSIQYYPRRLTNAQLVQLTS